jgi:hypothetical protein
VRSGKGSKDRMTMLPRALAGDLHDQLNLARLMFEQDRATGRAAVALPHALASRR